MSVLRTRWLPWTAAGAATAAAGVLLLSTVALATVKAVPVPGPTVTTTAAPTPAQTVTVEAAPRPARTVTVTDTARADALTRQLAACDDAWRSAASAEQQALTAYNDAVHLLADGVQTGDGTKIVAAQGRVEDATRLVDDATGHADRANATCGATS